ncbi:MAG: DNA-3-methyladenine glycosylase [Bdellovibrionales bacterium]|nr:DNA-3-methyladenine glycosylase [Bdellovibrionales bacterium]
MAKRLPQSFYARDTIAVARDLLGQRLVHQLPDGTRLSGRIVETEAYLGEHDPAAHSYGNRRTPRTEVMFGDPGLSYVYFIYGVHYCFNAITMARDVPEAVLVRALEISEGLEWMQEKRKPDLPVHTVANGPGKLCLALEIGRAHNFLDLTQSEILFIEEDGAVLDGDIAEGPRVGIGDRHDAVHWPLRFGIRNHPALSKPKFPDFHIP